MKGKLFEKLLLKLSILDYRATLNTAKPKFGAIFVFLGTTSSFNEIISSSETEAKREAILFLFACSEVNSTLLITTELANQNARKALFTCVVYTNTY